MLGFLGGSEDVPALGDDPAGTFGRHGHVAHRGGSLRQHNTAGRRRRLLAPGGAAAHGQARPLHDPATQRP